MYMCMYVCMCVCVCVCMCPYAINRISCEIDFVCQVVLIVCLEKVSCVLRLNRIGLCNYDSSLPSSATTV